MKDNIIKVDSRESYLKEMSRYSFYILYDRFTPDIRDGLKVGQRRILYAMWNDIKCTSIGTKRKSGNTVGQVMGRYHPHSDDAIYGTMKTLTNFFEVKVPLINYDSNSGSIQGGPQAAKRYTESYLSKFSMDCVIGELQEFKEIVDWQKTFDNHTVEPECLPVKVPLLLVNGVFSIAIGNRIECPSHSLNDVIDATINVLHNPKADVVLIPDPCQVCEIVDTDWKKISNTGFGNYIERGVIKLEHTKSGTDILHILSTPDRIFYESIQAKIEDLIKNKILIQIANIEDHSTNNSLDIHIILKKGSDPNYVKDILYKHTGMQDTKSINLRVIDESDIKPMSYKAYIMYFLEFRRSVKFRLYNFRLQKVETRLHQLDTYIKILESGDVENIIHMIRNQNSMDEAYLINWLMNKLKITDLQAKFILQTQIGKLSKGNLKKYKEEQSGLSKLQKDFINKITNEKLIDKEIEEELLEIKRIYGRPRQSILISKSQFSNIPEGEFKIVITEQNFIRKLQVNDPIKNKGDAPKMVLIADNSKDLLLFDEMGRVFKLPVHKIPLTDKNGDGCDIRLILRNLTSNIISCMYLPVIEHLKNKSSKCFIISVTKKGLIKRIDLDDIVNATPSGLIYSKLNSGDTVCALTIANIKSDVIVYTKSKALRITVDQVPYLKRSTLGNQSIKATKTDVDGLSVLTSKTKELVIVTAKGRFNKIDQSALPRSERNRAGNNVIKLVKGDYIKNIFPCNENTIIKITRPDEVLEINTSNIPLGSSISQGIKLTKDGIIKAELII